MYKNALSSGMAALRTMAAGRAFNFIMPAEPPVVTAWKSVSLKCHPLIFHTVVTVS